MPKLLLAVNWNRKSAKNFEGKAIHKTEICQKQANFNSNNSKNKQTASLQKKPATPQKKKPKFTGKTQGWQHCLKWTLEDLIAVLLLRNKDQEYNDTLASFAISLCLQSKDRTWANCALALSVSGASWPRLCPDGPRAHLSGPAYMLSCRRLEVRLPLHERVLCSDCCSVKNVRYYA